MVKYKRVIPCTEEGSNSVSSLHAFVDATEVAAASCCHSQTVYLQRTTVLQHLAPAMHLTLAKTGKRGYKVKPEGRNSAHIQQLPKS
jgi:hypothetical protein